MSQRPDRPETDRILVIEDDEDTRANLRDLLELDDYRVEAAASFAVLEEVRNYAAPLHLERTFSSLRDVWQEAWEQTSPHRQGRDAALAEPAQEESRCQIDRFR